MGGYVAQPAGPTRIDSVDPDDTTGISVRWAPYLASLNRTALSSAVWSTNDGIIISNESIQNDEDGNATVAFCLVDVTTAPLNSWVQATCVASAGLGGVSQSVLFQVRDR